MTAPRADVLGAYLETLPPLQRRFIEEAETKPHLFCVISWGCAATTWLAHVLNSHPEIFCAHASNTLWHDFGGARMVDGVEYLQILRIEGRTCIAAGDVHGVNRATIPELKDTFGADFSAAVLVREPMARLTSQMAVFEKYYVEHQPWDLGYVDHLIDVHGLALPDREYRTKLFIHGINMLNAITEEAAVGKIFRQEDITTEPANFQALVEELTAQKVTPNRAWCEAMLQTRPINPHKRARPVFQPEGWQLDVCRKVVSPDAWRIYSELGYPKPSFL